MKAPVARSLFLLLLAVLPAAAQIDSVPPAGTVAAEQDYAFARGLFQDSLYQLASAQFEMFLQRYPGSPRRMEASFLAPESRFRLGQYNDAIRGFSDFVELYPREKWSADAYSRLGESYLKLGRNAEAVEAYRTVLERFGESAAASEAAYWIGEAAFRQNDYELALKYYEMAYENRQSVRLRDYAVYSIGWVYQLRGAHHRAVEWFAKMESEFPDSQLRVPARLRMAESQLAMKEYAAALRAVEGLDSARMSNHELGEVRFLRGEVAYGLGDVEQARREYQEVRIRYPGHRRMPDALYGLAWTNIKLNDLDASLQLLDELVKGNSSFAEPALFRRGVVENLKGWPDRALGTWQSVIDRFPEGTYADNAMYESAVVRYNSGDVSGALATLDRMLQAHPESDARADALRLQGECYLALARFQEAHEVFRNLGALEGLSPDVRITASFRAAWSLFKMEDYAGSVPVFTRFIEAYPGHPQATDAAYWRAEAHYRLGRYLEAAEDYRAVAGASGTSHTADALYGLGWSQFKLGNYEGAVSSFERLIESHPQSVYVMDARIRLADCHFFLRQYDRAAGLYRSILRTSAGDSSLDYAHFQLAQTYHRAGDRRGAVSQYETLIRQFPGSPLADDAQYALGWISFQEKQYEQAIALFQRTVRGYPGSESAARALYSIGDAYYNQGNYAAAEKSYRQVLTDYPSSPFVVDAVGGIQYSRLALGDRTGAVQVIDEFLSRQPSSAAAEALLIKKGDIYYSQREYGKALAEYDNFIARYPSSSLVATAEYWAGRSLRSSGEGARAVERYQRAAAHPGGKDAMKAQALLEAADVQRQLNDLRGALSTLDRLEHDHGSSEPAAEGAYLRALVLEDSGDLLGTLAQLEQNLTRHAGTTAADRSRLKLSVLFLGEENFERSLALATAVATTRTDELGAEGQYLIGRTLAAQGKLEEAITAFLKVRYIFRQFDLVMARTYLGMGEVYERLREPQRARESYRRALGYEQLPEIAAEAQRHLDRLERR